MPKIKYVDKTFQPDTLALIKRCNAIIAEYAAQGFVLTLRQLYYQLVSRDVIRNRQSEYKRLGSIVSDARLAGLIDWNSIEDRTRDLRKQPEWDNPAEIVDEKDALVGVIEGVCNELGVPHFSCRGYTSQSEMWVAGQRLRGYVRKKQIPVIFHFGDHDPSGRDMTRDITDRLELFMGGLEVKRLALNMDQVEQYNPPLESGENNRLALPGLHRGVWRRKLGARRTRAGGDCRADPRSGHGPNRDRRMGRAPGRGRARPARARLDRE